MPVSIFLILSLSKDARRVCNPLARWIAVVASFDKLRMREREFAIDAGG
jgi:hypothetical protein